MEWVVLGFLAVSVFLYCLLAGADFGAGVLELFFPKNDREKYRNLIVKAMGPVWEANHIWLIIVIVILFNGFPKAYAEISIYFHIPLTLMLIGIILRGCSFTFRTYDTLKDQPREMYSRIFSLSSLLTPLMFGIIIGGLMLGRVDPGSHGYWAKFVDPWLNLFSISVGLFVLSIFTFLAAVFLIGETEDPDAVTYFSKYAQRMNIAMVITGAWVFAAAHFGGLNLFALFVSHPISLAGLIGASIPLWFLRKVLKEHRPWMPRSIVGFQLGMILMAWFALIYPNFIIYKNTESLTFFESLAPATTIFVLGWSLTIGSFLFLPALYYLIFIFKIRDPLLSK